MSELQNSPLHLAIIKAFPLGDFSNEAIALLSKFNEGKPIRVSNLGESERQVISRLQNAGLIETRRYPIRTNGMFAGFATSYVYSADLDYGGETKQSDGSKLRNIIYWLLIGFGYATALFLTGFLSK